MRKITIEEHTYPNGQPYRSVIFGANVIGSYRAVNGGFVPFGARKAVSEFEAIVAVIRRRQEKAQKELDFYETVHDAAFEQQKEWR